MDKLLDEREVCDLECLLIGAFSPLSSYMTRSEYESCLTTMKINETSVFPIPITCSVKDSAENGSIINLRSQTGVIYAKLCVTECWKPDLEYEWNHVFGTIDDNHPYIKYMKSKGDVYYVTGTLTKVNSIEHATFNEYRNTPAEIRSLGSFVGFQTRNPLHRSHVELIKNASKINVPILLHPVEGVTQECDIPFGVRMQCYKAVLNDLGENVRLSILPLSMRMAGPREAVWHAVIRKNYGCSHFIVGRDHAGPSYKKKDGSSFYGAYDAQNLAKSLEDAIGITILPSEEVVYAEDIDSYIPVSQSGGHTIKNISGTQLRQMLDIKQSVPTWFSYESVIKPLQDFYNKPKGICFYFVGLSGSGKSTLANALKAKIEEEYPTKEVTLLDADIIRLHLSKGLGFSKEDRSMNVRRIGYVASEIVRHGGIVIVANIAPYQEDRDYNRKLISQYGKYIEFFVDTPIEECEKRDVKGLYKAAKEGKIPNFTGVNDPFERPGSESIHIPFIRKGYAIAYLITFCLPLLSCKPRFAIVSAGGCATTAFMELLLSNGVLVNNSSDADSIKHTSPDSPMLKAWEPTKIIYLYGDYADMIRSMYRRFGFDPQYSKLNTTNIFGLNDITSLTYEFKNFEQHVDNIIKTKQDSYGIVKHFNSWKSVKDVFFIHYKDIPDSRDLEKFIGLPNEFFKNNFKLTIRESKKYDCETDEYLNITKNFIKL